MSGVNETTEFLSALELVLVNVKDASKDGLDLSDLKYLVKIISDFKTLEIAAAGIKDIPLELKDLNADEASQIVLKLFSIIAKLK